MPGVTLPADLGASLGNHVARTERMERRIVPAAHPPTSWPPIVFSYPGPLSNGVESPPWYPNGNVILNPARMSLLAAASSNHTVDVRVNGAFVQTFTLTAGNKTVVVATNITVNYGDYVTMLTGTVADTNLSVEFGVVLL